MEKELEKINVKLDKLLKGMAGVFKKDELLTVQEAANYLKASTRTLRTWRDDKLISYSKIGAKIYYRESDLEQFLKNHVIKAK